MKSSKIYIAALVYLALAGLVNTKSLSQPGTLGGTVRLSSAAIAAQSTANTAMSLEEIARRLIRERWEQSPVPQKYPIRLTIASVQVIRQEDGNYLVNTKYTMREYRSTLTHVIDYDSKYLLVKEADHWKLRSTEGGLVHSGSRYDAAATPPPAGETDVPAPSATAAAQPARDQLLQAQPQPLAAKHRVGERVDFVSFGLWRKAVIILVRDDPSSPYRVHPLGYTEGADDWVCCEDFTDHRSQLRPAGSHATEPVAGGEENDEVLKAMRGDPTAAVIASPAYGYVARPHTAAQPTQNPQAGANRGGSAVPLGEYNCVAMARQAGGGELIHVGGFTLQAGGAYQDEDNGHGTFTYDSNKQEIAFRGAAMDSQVGRYDTATATVTLKSPNNSVDCDR